MAVSQLITDHLIQETFVHAARNVSQTMLHREVIFVGRTTEPAAEATYQVIGNVGFAGEANGLVYLCFTEPFALHAAGLMLGMSPGEIEMHGPEVVKDAIGEITNMTAGGFKNQLCDLGLPCKLTLPTIVRGTRLSVAAIKSAHRHVFELTCDGHRFVADIQMKAE